MPPSLFVICGQTATGKSDLAVRLAQHYQGSVVSADSRQVYTELNYLSNKITDSEMCGIPHHLLNVAHINQTYTVADYQQSARSAIIESWARAELPILCGGTGLYIDAVMYNEYQFDSTGARSDINPRHAESSATTDRTAFFDVPTTWIGLAAPREFLRAKILARAENHIPHHITEVQQLIARGITRERIYSLGLEPRHCYDLIHGLTTESEYIEIITTKTVQYAKRQMTWFRRNPQIKWFDVSVMSPAEILSAIIDTDALSQGE